MLKSIIMGHIVHSYAWTNIFLLFLTNTYKDNKMHVIPHIQPNVLLFRYMKHIFLDQNLFLGIIKAMGTLRVEDLGCKRANSWRLELWCCRSRLIHLIWLIPWTCVIPTITASHWEYGNFDFLPQRIWNTRKKNPKCMATREHVFKTAKVTVIIEPLMRMTMIMMTSWQIRMFRTVIVCTCTSEQKLLQLLRLKQRHIDDDWRGWDIVYNYAEQDILFRKLFLLTLVIDFLTFIFTSLSEHEIYQMEQSAKSLS